MCLPSVSIRWSGHVCSQAYLDRLSAVLSSIKLPSSPADVEDDVYFRVILLGADFAAGVGEAPNPRAAEFIRTHSSPSDTRTYQNIVLVATPSVTGLHQAEQQIAEWLAWQDLEGSTQFKEMDTYQQETVRKRKRDTLKEAQSAVKNAYELVVFLDKDGSVQAKKITMTAHAVCQRHRGS